MIKFSEQLKRIINESKVGETDVKETDLYKLTKNRDTYILKLTKEGWERVQGLFDKEENVTDDGKWNLRAGKVYDHSNRKESREMYTIWGEPIRKEKEYFYSSPSSQSTVFGLKDPRAASRTYYKDKASGKISVSKAIFNKFIEEHLKPLESLEDRIKENYSKEPVGNETNRKRHEAFKKLARK